MGQRASAVLLIALIAACGDPDQHLGGRPDAGPADAAVAPDAGPAVTIDDVCAPDGALAGLFGRLLECNPAFDVIFLQGRLGPATVSAICNGTFGPYLTDGSIALPSRDQLAACAAFTADTSCLDLELALSNGGPCDLLAGTVADGDDCELDDQCADASYCDTTGPGCGTCTARLADGAGCTADMQCAGGACIGTQCGHLGVDGEPCVIAGPTDDGSGDCLGQRICDPATNHCATPPAWQLNDVCQTGTGDCDPFGTGLYCGAGGQCTPLLGLGATCRTGGNDVGFCDVRAYLHCPPGASAVCAAPTIQTTEDDPCDLLAGEQCGAGLTCTDVLNGGTCIDLQGENEACVAAGPPTDRCDLFLNCVASSCVYAAYSGTCP